MSVQGKIAESGQIAEQTALGVSEARADLVQHLEILLADGPETGEQWAEICRVEQQIADMDSAALSPAELNMINQAWENHKAAIPVAVVTNDNQPGRTAIIEITTTPPTLKVGTALYAAPKVIPMGGASISARELADEIYTQVALGNCVVCGVNALVEALTSAFVIRSRAEDRT